MLLPFALSKSQGTVESIMRELFMYSAVMFK